MATWTGTGSNNSNFTGTLTVSESSTSIQDNTSTLSYSLVLTGSSGYYFQQYYLTSKIYINGEEVQNRYEQISMPTPSGGTSTYTVCSGTVVVPHNNDGTKTVSVYATMQTPSTQAFLPGSINMPSGLDGTLTLSTIPRASSMTWGHLYIGQSATFTITRASNSFTHNITYTFRNAYGTVATGAGASATWTVPNGLFSELPEKGYADGTLKLTTLSGGNVIGSVEYQATFEVPASIKPTAPTVTLDPDNSSNQWLSDKNFYVAGYSKVHLLTSAYPGTGAGLSGFTVSGLFAANLDYNGQTTSGIIQSSGTRSITVTAIDSRGRTNSTTTTITVLPYTKPALTTFEAERGTYSNGSWTADPNGPHIHVHAVGQVASLQYMSGTKTVKIGNTSPAASTANDYYFNTTNASTSYVVTGTITDSMGNSSTRTLSVSTVAVPFNVNVDLPGAAFGMVAQTAKALEVASDWRVDVQGRLWTAQNQHYTDGTSYGLNMRDSDIINANGIYWADRANEYHEGLHFLRSNSNWDSIYADEGVVYFMPNHALSASSTAQKILTQDDLYYKNGDTLTVSNGILIGHITSAYKAIRLSLTVPKMLTNITSVTVNTMSGTMRGSLGYLDSVSTDRSWTSLGTVTANIASPNMIRINVDTTNAIGNVDLNTPIEFYSSNNGLTLTFNA